MNLNTLNALVQELQRVVTLENKPILNHLDHINSLLHNAALKCIAAITVSADQPHIYKDYSSWSKFATSTIESH